MTYSMEIKMMDDFFWVTISGTRSLVNILDVTEEVVNKCSEQNISKILADVRDLHGHLSTGSAFAIPTNHFKRLNLKSVISKIAVIDHTEGSLPQKFFENIAVKQGYNIKFFSDPTSAEKWIIG